MHGREAIVLGSLCITTVDHGAPRRKGLHNAICSVSHDGLFICACAAGTRPRPTAVSRRTFSANLEHYGITVTLVPGLAQASEIRRVFGKEVGGPRWAAKRPLLHSTHSQIARVVSLETITQNGAAPRYCYRVCARTNIAVPQNSWRRGPLFLPSLRVIGNFPWEAQCSKR